MTERKQGIAPPAESLSYRTLLLFGYAMAGVAFAIAAPFVIAGVALPALLGAHSLRPAGGMEWAAAVVSSFAWWFGFQRAVDLVGKLLQAWSRKAWWRAFARVVAMLATWVAGMILWLLTYQVVKTALPSSSL